MSTFRVCTKTLPFVIGFSLVTGLWTVDGSAQAANTSCSTLGKRLSALKPVELDGALPALDGLDVHWTSGLPNAGLRPSDLAQMRRAGEAFAWTRVDLDGDHRDETLVQASILQGVRGRYYSALQLFVLCGPADAQTTCANLGFGSSPFFTAPGKDGRAVQAIGPADFKVPPQSPPLRLALLPQPSGWALAVVSEVHRRSSKPQMDLYGWSARSGRVALLCQCRKGVCK